MLGYQLPLIQELHLLSILVILQTGLEVLEVQDGIPKVMVEAGIWLIVHG
jgi:hypothetical protein